MDCPCLPLCCRPALLAWTVKQMYPTPGLYFHMDTVAWIGRCFRVYMKELFAPKWAACTLCSSSSELAHADHALKPSEILPVYLKGKTHFPCIRVKGCQSHSISQRTHKHPKVLVTRVWVIVLKAEQLWWPLLGDFLYKDRMNPGSFLLGDTTRSHRQCWHIALAMAQSLAIAHCFRILILLASTVISKVCLTWNGCHPSVLSPALPLQAEHSTGVWAEVLCWASVKLDVENNQEGN